MISQSFKRWLWLINILILLYVLAPILVVIASSFGQAPFMEFPPRGFTLKWFNSALTDRQYWSGFWTSVRVGAITALFATVIGAMASWALVRYTKRLRSVLESFLLLPITLPHLILGIGLLTMTQTWGLNSSLSRLVVGHIVITIPYVLRILVPVIAELSADIEEAAADLGASPGTAFLTVTLPLLLPTLVVCAGVAFMVSFDELVLALFLAPPAKYTIPLVIFSKVEFNLEPSVGAISTLLLVATLAFMLLGQALSRFRFMPAGSSTHHR